ncbi:alpha/beta-hydrolase [Auricularia subglabra TFB-10046 SS5]|nr:alpha/beta-hydrolase [Auricularia subglabra TFB-10046 SS5]
MSTESKLSHGAHSFATPKGATLTYHVTGRGPRVLINVAPGWGASSAPYHGAFSDLLAGTFTIAHLECRGTRGSSFPDDLAEMSSWHMGADVEALREHLGLDSADVVGHSNGATIALWHAIRFPRRTHRLALLGADVLGTPRAAALARMLDARAAAGEQAHVDAFREYIRSAADLASDDEMRGWFDKFMLLYVARPARDGEAWRQSFSVAPQVRVMQAQARVESQHPDQLPFLKDVAVRTLLLVGKEDFVCPPVVSEIAAAAIKDSSLVVIEDCGHVPWIEKPEEFVNAMRDFFM